MRFSIYILISFVLAGSAVSPPARAASLDMAPNQPRDEVIILLEQWKAKLTQTIEKNKTRWAINRENFLYFNVPDDLHKTSPTMGLLIAALTEAEPAPGYLAWQVPFKYYITIRSKNFSLALERINDVEARYAAHDHFCTLKPSGNTYFRMLDVNEKGVRTDDPSTVPVPACYFEGAIIYKTCKIVFKDDSWVLERKGKEIWRSYWKQEAYDAMFNNIACTGAADQNSPVYQQELRRREQIFSEKSRKEIEASNKKRADELKKNLESIQDLQKTIVGDWKLTGNYANPTVLRFTKAGDTITRTRCDDFAYRQSLGKTCKSSPSEFPTTPLTPNQEQGTLDAIHGDAVFAYSSAEGGQLKQTYHSSSNEGSPAFYERLTPEGLENLVQSERYQKIEAQKTLEGSYGIWFDEAKSHLIRVTKDPASRENSPQLLLKICSADPWPENMDNCMPPSRTYAASLHFTYDAANRALINVRYSDAFKMLKDGTAVYNSFSSDLRISDGEFDSKGNNYVKIDKREWDERARSSRYFQSQSKQLEFAFIGDWFSQSSGNKWTEDARRFYRDETGRVLMLVCDPKLYRKSHGAQCKLAYESAIPLVYDTSFGGFCISTDPGCSIGVKFLGNDRNRFLYFENPRTQTSKSDEDKEGYLFFRVTKSFQLAPISSPTTQQAEDASQ